MAITYIYKIIPAHKRTIVYNHYVGKNKNFFLPLPQSILLINYANYYVHFAFFKNNTLFHSGLPNVTRDLRVCLPETWCEYVPYSSTTAQLLQKCENVFWQSEFTPVAWGWGREPLRPAELSGYKGLLADDLYTLSNWKHANYDWIPAKHISCFDCSIPSAPMEDTWN